jgi:P-type Ca2+ transporter type 2C
VSAVVAPRNGGRAAVVVVSAAVPGRVRVRLPALRDAPALAYAVETRLTGHPAVHRVTTNPTTGSVLVQFDARRLDVRHLLATVGRETAAARAGRNGHRDPAAPAWHTLGTKEVVDRLATSVLTGLTPHEAERRRLEHGGNVLPMHRPKSGAAIVRDHLSSLPVVLLGGAAALSLVGGAVLDAAVILAVVAANAAVGYVTESRVERILTALQNATIPQAVVRRDGVESVVPAAALAPGDLIVLRAGYDVPADARLLAADGLTVDESALTGESLAVTKSAHEACPADAALGDRRNMVYAGTAVAEGAALACVTGLGGDSELGRIRALVSETSTPPTPLERQLDRLGRGLVGVSLGGCAAALALGLLRGVPLVEMLRSAVSLAVAAVPEGLPAVATTTLALGMQRLMHRGVLVRRLAAVESLGATTVICADKTGTLTENRMVAEVWYVGEREYRRRDLAEAVHGDDALRMALTIAALCNDAELVDDDVRGSATEGALLLAAQEAGLDYRALRAAHPVVDSRPRRDGDTWMATVHVRGDRRLTALKGAPEDVLARASRIVTANGVIPLEPRERQRIRAREAAIAARGLRVLGLAYADRAANGAYDDLVWVGLVALTDPVREGVREAIAACRRAGIRTIMLTGDHPQTAAAISRELGLGGRVVEASELASVDTGRLAMLAAEADVFARVSPANKYQIVRALQAAGHVVAMTGDGINDAAALRAADIGVAMGARGTDLARDVADVVLLQDDFAALLGAVAQGRAIHTNVSRSLRFLLSTNASEIMATLGALAIGMPRPLSAIQLLWINLLSDVAPALALAVEPADRAVMERPPRDPATPMVSSGDLREIAADGALLTAVALTAQAVGLARYGAGPQAATLGFSTLTSAQLLHTFRYRAVADGSGRTVVRSRVSTVVLASLGAQLAAMLLPPLRRLLGVTPLAPADWLVVAAGALAPAVLHEGRRRLSTLPNQRDGGPSHGHA